MVPVRTTVEISAGVKVELLFTPRVSAYQKEYGALQPVGKDNTALEVLESYADVMFFAALNAWELDGHGTRDDFPHQRGDFHGWMTADPKGFGNAVQFAVRALTGKSIKELTAETEKAAENARKSLEEEVKKKGWLSRITSRLRRSS